MFTRWDPLLAGLVFLVALWVNLSAVTLTEFHRDEARWVHLAIRGLLAVFKDDHEVLALGLTLFDGLYAGIGEEKR